MTCHEWLSNNGYEEVAALIDEAMAKMGARGSKQRRNWWDILSGGAEGKPCICEGIRFPVLRVSQRRQGKQITENAISRNNREEVPEIVQTGRWGKSQLRAKSTVSNKSASGYEGSNEAKHRRAS